MAANVLAWMANPLKMYQRYNQAGHTVVHALPNRGCALTVQVCLLIISTIVNREVAAKMDTSLKDKTSEYSYRMAQCHALSTHSHLLVNCLHYKLTSILTVHVYWWYSQCTQDTHANIAWAHCTYSGELLCTKTNKWGLGELMLPASQINFVTMFMQLPSVLNQVHFWPCLQYECVCTVGFTC